MTKVAALFTIGITDGGCSAAIAEIVKREKSLEVHLLYGKRGAPDAPDPMETVERIKSSVYDAGVTWASSGPVEPFDLSKTYDGIRRFMSQIAACSYDRVYLGITGGTNPMVTSLFQTAMAYLSCEVIPLYAQARGATPVLNFVASDVRDRVIAEDALATARSGQIRVAARLADRLQSEEDWKFLRSSLHALAQWDDFDYGQAKQSLQHPSRKATERLTHQILGGLAKTVTALAENAAEMSALTRNICDEQNFGNTVLAPGWPSRLSKAGPLLVADTLANARRRITEGRYTDSVLRAYRAAECATQMRLLALDIHPARPNACPTAYARYPQLARADAAGPPGIAFKAGLTFLGSAGVTDLSVIEEPVRNLGNARNHTYLEHGYVRVSQEQAERCLEWSVLICEHLLGNLGDKRQHFEMQF